MIQSAQVQQALNIRKRATRLPTGHGLPRHVQIICDLLLGEVKLLSRLTELCTDCDHICLRD